MTSHASKASAYRRKSALCGELAAFARAPADRDSLLRMQQSFTALAENEEWLDGLPPPPPGNASALAAGPRKETHA